MFWKLSHVFIVLNCRTASCILCIVTYLGISKAPLAAELLKECETNKENSVISLDHSDGGDHCKWRDPDPVSHRPITYSHVVISCRLWWHSQVFKSNYIGFIVVNKMHRNTQSIII